MKTNIYAVADHETWTVIEKNLTLEEAKKKLAEFEESDKLEGIYSEDFYDIIKEGKEVKWEPVEL